MDVYVIIETHLAHYKDPMESKRIVDDLYFDDLEEANDYLVECQRERLDSTFLVVELFPVEQQSATTSPPHSDPF